MSINKEEALAEVDRRIEELCSNLPSGLSAEERKALSEKIGNTLEAARGYIEGIYSAGLKLEEGLKRPDKRWNRQVRDWADGIDRHIWEGQRIIELAKEIQVMEQPYRANNLENVLTTPRVSQVKLFYSSKPEH